MYVVSCGSQEGRLDTMNGHRLASAAVKKIKRNMPKGELRRPTFVIGYAAPEPIPPGFLVAWFNDEYGGPLKIDVSPDFQVTQFEAHHGPWSALVDPNLPPSISDPWRERLGWGHQRSAHVLPLRPVGLDVRDVVLHVARLARGLTLLTGGTAHDVATETYFNPSDWTDRPLRQFRIADHLRIEQVSGREDGRVWFHTRGLSKFGLEDIEAFRPAGLSERSTIEALSEIAEALIERGKSPTVGEQFDVPALNRSVCIVRHRTDQSYGILLHLREIEWDEPGANAGSSPLRRNLEDR